MDPVILVFAVLAAVILFRLYSVLGRRTGHEQSEQDLFSRRKSARDEAVKEGNVITLPGADRKDMDLGEGAEDGDAPGLDQIRKADPHFSTGHFLTGAQTAYEMIVSSFAGGDASALEPLLSKDVFKSFSNVIEARRSRGETASSQMISIGDASIIDTRVVSSAARITVDFTSEQVRYVKNADGAVIEGDPSRVDVVRDRWTFERDLNSDDPNWILVATGVAH